MDTLAGPHAAAPLCSEERQKMALHFLIDLMDVPSKVVAMYVDSVGDDWLLQRLDAVDSLLRHDPQSEHLVNDSLLLLICEISRSVVLERCPGLFELACCIVAPICQRGGTAMKRLRKMDYCSRLVDIMSEEPRPRNVVNAAARLLACFLPAVPDSRCFRDVNDGEILTSGWILRSRDDDDGPVQWIVATLELVLPNVIKLCRHQRSHHLQRLLLLKLVYWADAMGILCRHVLLDELVEDIGNMMLPSRHTCDVRLGLTFVHLLLESGYGWILEHARIHEAVKAALHRPLQSRRDWIDKLDEALGRLPNELRGEVGNFAQALVGRRFSSKCRTSVVSFMLQFILPPERHLLRPKASLDLCYARLTAFVDVAIRPSRSLGRSAKRGFTFAPSGIGAFESMVGLAMEELESFELMKFASVRDMLQEKNYDESRHRERSFGPSDVRLGLLTLPSLDRVLGPSFFPDELSCNPLVRCLRLLSILYELNENWGVLYCTLTTERFCDKELFVSKSLGKKIANMMKVNSCCMFSSMLKNYPFLLPYEIRLQAVRIDMDNVTFVNPYSDLIEVSRDTILASLARGVDLLNTPEVPWNFKFEGEKATGEGPTKEFYTEFSRDCQKHEFGLWIGEPQKGPSGILYTYSPCGLFPAPKLAISKDQERMYVAIGKIIGKTLLDSHQLDVHFSRALYKRLFLRKGLTLNDLKDVAPNVFNFAESLAEVVKEKHEVMNQMSFQTSEEKEELLSRITCDGVAFEDLCIDFTVPEFPELELKEGGRNQELTVHNVEEYLRLLVWRLLYDLPSLAFQKLQEGLSIFLPFEFNLLHPEEIEQILCGSSHEVWTVDYLSENCLLDNGLKVHSPVVQYLFEVLSSLTSKEQRQFLKFVTSVPRLPFGGLASLKPKMSVIHRGCDTDPDACLPSSMTCFNSLFVTNYKSKEALREKLLLAIQEGDSFQFA